MEERSLRIIFKVENHLLKLLKNRSRETIENIPQSPHLLMITLGTARKAAHSTFNNQRRNTKLTQFSFPIVSICPIRSSLLYQDQNSNSKLSCQPTPPPTPSLKTTCLLSFFFSSNLAKELPLTYQRNIHCLALQA